tara:strand:+ start:2677 stop:2898 length:222 start_codon:yes stop_codon:yes gene_type:complete
MSVTLFNSGGTINIHRTGCQDIKRGENKFWARGAEIFPTVEEAYNEYADTGDENNPGWLPSEFNIYPCTESTL